MDESSDEEDGINGDSEDILGDIIDTVELTQEDILYGYTPDDQYNVTEMEEEGEYYENIEWEYSDIGNEQEDINYPRYNGPGPALRHNVSRQFSTPLGACGIAGGLSYDLIKRITSNTNATVRSRLTGNNSMAPHGKI